MRDVGGAAEHMADAVARPYADAGLRADHRHPRPDLAIEPGIEIGGIGLEGTPVNNDLVREADFVLTVGSRLTDFPTASQSLFENPDVVFASINVNGLG